jgi:hypothetical protein
MQTTHPKKSPRTPPPPAGDCPPSLARRRALLFPCWRLRLSLVTSVGSARRAGRCCLVSPRRFECGSGWLRLFPTTAGVRCWIRVALCLFGLWLFFISYHALGCTLPLHRIALRPSLRSWMRGVGSVLVGSATVALVGVVHLAGGVAVATPMPFGLQSESLSPPSWRDG